MPVITPPAVGMEEQASKNWYRAEALRKIASDLTAVWQDIDHEAAALHVEGAVQSIEQARRELDPRLKRTRLEG